MARYVGAAEAAKQLGVRKQTLYAYVSRGLIDRRVAVDGRTSLYSIDDLDALARRQRRREAVPRPSLDVQIATGITTLDEDGVRYRGHDVAELARTCTYEQVAELLWTGELPPPKAAPWPSPADEDAAAVRRATGAGHVGRDRLPGVGALIAAANALGELGQRAADPASAARRLLSAIPVAFGETIDGSDERRGLTRRLLCCWHPEASAALTTAFERALVLLADHELATSTLAVRLAGSVRADPYRAFVAGLAVVSGPSHGGAAREVGELLADCERDGVAAVVEARLARGATIPGFGHKIYKGTDPRLAPLLDAVAAIPDADSRLELVDDLVSIGGERLIAAGRTRGPNVDLGVGGLLYVAGLPAATPVFAVARIAGFAAHLAEELTERPVRYRGIAR